jgi:hypothetical protein
MIFAVDKRKLMFFHNFDVGFFYWSVLVAVLSSRVARDQMQLASL